MEGNNINKILINKGLNDREVIISREKFGINKIEKTHKKSLILQVLSIFKEPMFLLLIIAASVYFIVGEYNDGIIMLIFVIVICSIEYIQEAKTTKALEELNKLSALDIKVIRNGQKKIISSDDLVVGDIVQLEEGDSVPADGKVLYAQSLGINESSLTGETETVYKSTKEEEENHFKRNMCYSGTSVTNGLGIIEIVAVGEKTEIGKIGASLNNITTGKTPLEKQLSKLVFICTIISGIVFLLTILINYINHPELVFTKRIVDSILAGITIAMATIPEEIPVILTVFLAMGAWNLSKEKTLTKNRKAIETLGTISVLCTDKTGTLTENKMKVQDIYQHSNTFLETSYLSCPILAYDSMDVAIKKYCEEKIVLNKYQKVTKEYAFTPETKMMGLLWDNRLLCVKGAYESILPLCNLNKDEYEAIKKRIYKYTKEGYRVLAVAKKENLTHIPNTIKDIELTFEGLLILYDSPRSGVKDSIETCNQAGIRIIMITGDNGETALGIAKKLNISNANEVITGTDLEKMSDDELFERVKTVNIYARVYPNHKMRIINALQKNNQIVAMTGDGVNDATALKRANIGIAMGKRGTNVAKESADIILLDDNFNTIVKAIKNGRGIYKNIKKAISYILVIHIPIALLSLFVPIFKLPTLLLPVHIMLLELLIDPTSSIVFQRIKTKEEIMLEKPRKIDESILNKQTVLRCILQGSFIFLIAFINYYILIHKNIDVHLSISITYSILVLSIMLVTFQLKGRELTITAFIKSFNDKITLFINIGIILGLIALLYIPFFNSVAHTSPIGIKHWLYIITMTILSIIPFDLLKILNTKQKDI